VRSAASFCSPVVGVSDPTSERASARTNATDIEVFYAASAGADRPRARMRRETMWLMRRPMG